VSCVVQLWYAYLSERVSGVRGLPPKAPALQALANTFERSLVTMHKMPRIWLMYLQVSTRGGGCLGGGGGEGGGGGGGFGGGGGGRGGGGGGGFWGGR